MKKHLNRRIRQEVDKHITRLLNPRVQIVTNETPVYASPGSAGFDIRADLWGIKEEFMRNAEVVRNEGDASEGTHSTIESIVVHPGGHCLVPTGIYTSFDSIYEMQIRPRSGNALKMRVTITNSPGTIDSDYRDEWGIIIDNEGEQDFVIKQGDRIAQAVMAIVCRPVFEFVETTSELTGPNRGGGYGHSVI